MALIFGHIFASLLADFPLCLIVWSINAGVILLVSKKFVRLTKFSYNSFRFNK